MFFTLPKWGLNIFESWESLRLVFLKKFFLWKGKNNYKTCNFFSQRQETHEPLPPYKYNGMVFALK